MDLSDDPNGDPVICVCNGVTEDEIVAAIEGGADTVQRIRDACGANTTCGGCREDIEELLADVAPALPAPALPAPVPPAPVPPTHRTPGRPAVADLEEQAS